MSFANLPFVVIQDILDFYAFSLESWQQLNHLVPVIPVLGTLAAAPTFGSLIPPLNDDAHIGDTKTRQRTLMKNMFGYHKLDPYRNIYQLYRHVKIVLSNRKDDNMILCNLIRFRAVKSIEASKFVLTFKLAQRLLSYNPNLVELSNIALDSKMDSLFHQLMSTPYILVNNEMTTRQGKQGHVPRKWKRLCLENMEIPLSLEAAKYLSKICTLREIDFTGIALRTECVRWLVKLPNLNIVTVEQCQLNDESAALLLAHPSIAQLRLGDNNLTSNCVQMLANYRATVMSASTTSKLKKLSFSANRNMGDGLINALLAHSTMLCTELEQLELAACQVTSIGIQKLLSALVQPADKMLKRLHTLDISDNELLTSDCLQPLLYANSKNTCLHKLNLSYNEWVDNDCVVKYLKDNTCLTSLDLSNTSITGACLDAITTMTSLQDLHLRFVNIAQDQTGLMPLVQHPTLESLDLFCTTMDAPLLYGFATNCFQQKKFWKELVLQGISACDDVIVRLLIYGSLVMHLNVENTSVTDEGLQDLPVNTCIQSLKLGGNAYLTGL